MTDFRFYKCFSIFSETFFTILFQRPTAKELLRHPFIKKAKRNNHLIDLIDRFRKWKLTHSADSDSESDSDADATNNSDDSDWNLTVKGSVSPYIEQFENSVVLEKENNDSRDKKSSVIMTSLTSSTQNNVVEINRDIEVKNNSHHRSSTNNSGNVKIHNGSSVSPSAGADVVLSPSKRQQPQSSPSKEKLSPRREGQPQQQQPHRSPATPATKSELNIVSFYQTRTFSYYVS